MGKKMLIGVHISWCLLVHTDAPFQKCLALPLVHYDNIFFYQID